MHFQHLKSAAAAARPLGGFLLVCAFLFLVDCFIRVWLGAANDQEWGLGLAFDHPYSRYGDLPLIGFLYLAATYCVWLFWRATSEWRLWIRLMALTIEGAAAYVATMLMWLYYAFDVAHLPK